MNAAIAIEQHDAAYDAIVQAIGIIATTRAALEHDGAEEHRTDALWSAQEALYRAKAILGGDEFMIARRTAPETA
jgi:hypothetical protein